MDEVMLQSDDYLQCAPVINSKQNHKIKTMLELSKQAQLFLHCSLQKSLHQSFFFFFYLHKLSKVTVVLVNNTSLLRV